VEGTEVRKLAALEDAHWWYRERRHLLGRMIDGLRPGTALDIGAAGGGNTRVLRSAGWSVSALEYGADGAEVAAERGLAVVRGDATALPVADASLDLVVAFDVLEHIVDDDTAVDEVRRVLRPGGRFLIAVPADPKLWSDHDVAVDHVRRYTRVTLRDVLERAAATRGGPAASQGERVRPRDGAPRRQLGAPRDRDGRALPAGEGYAWRDADGAGSSAAADGPVSES
jgi:SAM-dependent methyltransferase